jgi:uncharacterized lipoprotein YajG
MTPRRILGVVMLWAALGGCAAKTRLDVGLKPFEAGFGPLAAVPTATVKVVDLADQRPDRARIGYTKTGFGDTAADILTVRPVATIVRDAIVTEFTASGHRAGDDADLIVSGAITTFWFDWASHSTSLELTGTVAADLTISDAASGRPLVRRAYRGRYSETSLVGVAEPTWQRVMNIALQRMVRDVAADPGLLTALRERGVTRAAAHAP